MVFVFYSHTWQWFVCVLEMGCLRTNWVPKLRFTEVNWRTEELQFVIHLGPPSRSHSMVLVLNNSDDFKFQDLSVPVWNSCGNFQLQEVQYGHSLSSSRHAPQLVPFRSLCFSSSVPTHCSMLSCCPFSSLHSPILILFQILF